MRLTLSLGQMHIQFGDPESNFEQVRNWTLEAARLGSALVLFPELCLFGLEERRGDLYSIT